MKRNALFILLFLIAGILNAQGIHVESSTKTGLQLHYVTPRISMSNGLPSLPSESRYIAVPQGATVNITVKENGSSTLNDIDLSSLAKTIKGANIPNADIVTAQPTQIRGLDVVLISVTPYRYDSTKKHLEVVHDIDIDIRFEGGNGQFGESRYLSPDWEHILRDLVINGEMLPKTDYYNLIKSARDNDEESCEYLIIAPDNAEALAWADTLKAFRTKQGILTKVTSLSECGGNNANNIRNYLLSAYENWTIPPAAVLLFGGYRNGTGIVPFYHYTIPDEQYSTRRYPTDYPYCDMNGDSLPDMAISRITARSTEEYRTFVEKTIQYESNPPTDEAYYDHPIITAGHEDNKWFMLSSQSINGFYRDKLGKHPANFYMLHNTSAMPPDSIWSTAYNASVVLDYFGPNGQNYIPELIGDLHEWITKSDTVPLHTALHKGAFMTVYRGHSNYNGWWFPSFRVTSLDYIVNEPLTFVLSISCSTTLFTESGRGLIDAFCIKEHGGAVGGIGAASLTHSFFNDILAWGLYDCIWPDYMPNLGGETPPDFIRPSFALAEAKHYFAYHVFLPDWWPNIEQSTMHLFSFTGETYLNLFTEVPQPLQITHGLYQPSGSSEYMVTAEEGAVVCLSKDGMIIGVAQSEGLPITFVLPDLEEGDPLTITATKQNHFRYEYEVPVISNSGPYVVVERDGFLVENGSDILHNGENTWVGLQLHNYGNNTAGNVTMSLSCESPFIEITQNTCQAQNIASDQTVTLHNAFRINIAEDIPDMSEVVFTIYINDGNGEKECSFKQHIAAPKLIVNPQITYGNSNQPSILQIEKEGNTDIHIRIANEGHFNSNPANLHMEILAPFITIDSPSRMFNSIEKGSVHDVVFSINSHDSPVDEGWLRTKITLDDGVYQTIIDTLLPFGGFNETFDPDYFNTHDWQMSGNSPWTITDDEVHSGDHSTKSGELSHSQSSSISITLTTKATEISFFKKISSEFNYDKLRFYIDDENMDIWSGSRPWSEERYPLTQGTHTFRWTYNKDNSVSLGHDCAWIDDINIEPELTTIAFSGGILKTCESGSINIGCNYAYHYQDLEWTTLGDGQFVDSHTLHPEYIPGQQDLANAGTTLHLNVDGNISPLQLILTDEINLGNDIFGDDWIDPETTVFSHYSVDDQVGIEYIWQLEPEEAGHIFAHGNEADIVWSFDHDITEAILTVSANTSCSQSLSKTIQIDILSVEEQNLSPFTLYPNPTDGKVSLSFDETLQGKAIVEVYNLLGERMMVKNVNQLTKGSTFNLDLNRLASGLYIVILNTEKGSYGKKVSLK